MATKSKLEKIPMFPTRVWNPEKNCLETNGTYSHVAYDGEVQYDHTQKDGLGRPTKILPTLFLNTLLKMNLSL